METNSQLNYSPSSSVGNDLYYFPRNMSKHQESTAVRWKHLQLSRAKLKASSRTSALLSGFAMVAMVEVQIDKDVSRPPELVIAFCVCTTLLVACHMLSLMISTCILPNLEAASSTKDSVWESPHERMKYYIEASWICSTLLGLILFLVDVGLLCWVKFHDLPSAQYASAAIIAPLILLFLIFAIHFYRSLVAHVNERIAHKVDDLDKEMERLRHDVV
ncbi:LOW QUALITY PROTEIN: calcium release-activated calcium channel protein 1-like [Paramacrobiotus metropolitanus]|uniref:LOW QUALITY PROTEIN: calcium release-activated calcium channel protein 1-like n=1 Tax=Paramacrobiotus metropolitanus TaxID=2943436 RepID=UPI002445E722|nr:LOW QUALITY PROTEIN: calcium release-activated calcium channel protein 1-like [Paramacrobiotus metropolitanus]